MNRRNKSTVRQIVLGGKTLSYELVLGSYKNINLRVRRDGSIRVSADRRLPPERVDSFLREKEAWIENTLCRLRETENSLKEAELLWQNGGVVPVFGRECVIRVCIGKNKSAIFEGDQLIVTITDPCEAEIRGAVRRMLERELERVVSEMLDEVLPRFLEYGIPVPQIKFRYMVSRWGSCCPSKETVTLNKYLACVPISCIEYVLVHELAHFLELNHSPKFWAIVEKAYPDWRARKQELVPYGFLLRRL